MTTLTTNSLTILVPTNEVESRTARLAPRLGSLRGARLGVLDNAKPNSDRLLALVVNRLVESKGIAVAYRDRKPATGRLAPDTIIERLVEQCDVVLTGVGDCAGCCSCTVADAVTLEQRGIPVVALCTTEFATAAAVAAASAGAPGYEVAIIDHPLGSCTDEELEQRAASVLLRVSELMTVDGGAEVVGGGSVA